MPSRVGASVRYALMAMTPRPPIVSQLLIEMGEHRREWRALAAHSPLAAAGFDSVLAIRGVHVCPPVSHILLPTPGDRRQVWIEPVTGDLPQLSVLLDAIREGLSVNSVPDLRNSNVVEAAK